MQNPYIQVLIQWLFLFGLLTIILLPAMMFRKIALRSNKKGWVYFLAGMSIGLISLQAARGLTLLLTKYEILTQNGSQVYSVILFLGFPGLVVAIAVMLFRRSMLSNE